MDNHRGTDLVLDALDMANRQRKPVGVIHHSDQGTQYTSLVLGKRCNEAGVLPSMGSVGDAHDNALCKSFFATLECEWLDRHTFPDRKVAGRVLFDFIEGRYNSHRRHSSIGSVSAVGHKREYDLAA